MIAPYATAEVHERDAVFQRLARFPPPVLVWLITTASPALDRLLQHNSDAGEAEIEEALRSLVPPHLYRYFEPSFLSPRGACHDGDNRRHDARPSAGHRTRTGRKAL